MVGVEESFRGGVDGVDVSLGVFLKVDELEKMAEEGKRREGGGGGGQSELVPFPLSFLARPPLCFSSKIPPPPKSIAGLT